MKDIKTVIAEITNEYDEVTNKTSKLDSFLLDFTGDPKLKLILLTQYHAMRAYADSLLVRRQYLAEHDEED